MDPENSKLKQTENGSGKETEVVNSPDGCSHKRIYDHVCLHCGLKL